jgi:outer membrane protein TolC
VNWLTWPGRVWSLGPSLAETIFESGARRATVQQYRAAYDATAADYRQTVLTSFQQVEDNLAALRVLGQVVEEQEGAIASARRNLQEAGVRYAAGLDPYLNVIAAQTALLTSEQAQIGFREQQMVASVQLIKALGGGWDTTNLPTP